MILKTITTRAFSLRDGTGLACEGMLMGLAKSTMKLFHKAMRVNTQSIRASWLRQRHERLTSPQTRALLMPVIAMLIRVDS